MNDFTAHVDKLCGRLGLFGDSDNNCSSIESKSGKLTVDDLVRTVDEMNSEPVNCYPGEPGHGCHRRAYLFALKDETRVVKTRMLSFSDAIEQLIKHLVNCRDITKEVIFVTDHWDPAPFRKWEQQIRVLSRDATIEFFVLAGDEPTPVRF